MKRDTDPARSRLEAGRAEHELLAAIAGCEIEKIDLERENAYLWRRIEDEDERLARA